MNSRYGQYFYREHIADIAIAAQTMALTIHNQRKSEMTTPAKVLTPNRGGHPTTTIHHDPMITESGQIVSNLTIPSDFHNTFSQLTHTPLLPATVTTAQPPIEEDDTQPFQPVLLEVDDTPEKQRRVARAELVAHDVMMMIRGALDGDINAVSDAYDAIKAKVRRYGYQVKCDTLTTLINPDWLDPEIAAGIITQEAA